MARIELAPEVLDDFDRFFDHLAEFGAAAGAPARIKEIVEAVDILTHSPLIGRKVKGAVRELVIGRFVLAIRSQREAGYKRRR